MLYLVRGKSNDQDRCLRVHAESAEEAEAIGWKRGLFVTGVEPLEKESATMSRISAIINWAAGAWRPTSTDKLKCFGQPVSRAQSAALVLLGCATWVINLKQFGFVHI
jgi:hypothetical protein